MHTEIKKWGNSAVVRLPAVMLAQLRLDVGSPVELTVDENGFRIVPTTPKFEYKLDDLLAGVTPDNCHDSIDWGPSVGHEAAV